MNKKFLVMGILFSLVILFGCNSTYDPDDPIIERNFWNRTELLDGVYLIYVRGDIVVWEHGYLKLGSVEEDGSDFDEVKKYILKL